MCSLTIHSFPIHFIYNHLTDINHNEEKNEEPLSNPLRRTVYCKEQLSLICLCTLKVIQSYKKVFFLTPNQNT